MKRDEDDLKDSFPCREYSSLDELERAISLNPEARRASQILDQLADILDESCPQSSLNTKENLRQFWREKVYYRSVKDMMLDWYRTYLKPSILIPILPHLSLIVAFMFIVISFSALHSKIYLRDLNEPMGRDYVLVLRNKHDEA